MAKKPHEYRRHNTNLASMVVFILLSLLFILAVIYNLPLQDNSDMQPKTNPFHILLFVFPFLLAPVLIVLALAPLFNINKRKLPDGQTVYIKDPSPYHPDKRYDYQRT